MYNTWEELEAGINECKNCKLHSTRKNIVFGVRKQRGRFNVYWRRTRGRRGYPSERPLLEKQESLWTRPLLGLE